MLAGRLLAWVACLAVALPLVGAASPRDDRQVYVGPTHDTSARFFDCRYVPAPLAVDGACFPLQGTEQRVVVAVSDVSGLPIPVHLFWRAADGIAVGDPDFFCGPPQDLAVPAGAATLLVWPLPDDSIDPAFGYCPTVHGTAIAGTIDAAFA
jgi:hypothetical protein